MSTKNQCDGCQAKAPINDRGIHVFPDGSRMACEAYKYDSPVALGHPGDYSRETTLEEYIKRKQQRQEK